MEKKKRLGRGLDDVADLWLSSTATTSNQTDFDGEGYTGFTSKTISLIFPESNKIKGLLITNLAFELAKLGYGPCIVDYTVNSSAIKPFTNNLFHNTSIGESQKGSSESHQVFRLFGMPSIHVFSNTESGDISEKIPLPLNTDNLFTKIERNNLQDSIIFLYHQDTLESIIDIEEIPSIVIMASKPRRESLLVSYAYIKTILNKNQHIKIWMIMDESSSFEEGLNAFSRLNESCKRLIPHIKHPLRFLGSIIHDQALGISLASRHLLVLSEENSSSKEGISQIADNIIKFLESTD